MRWSRGGFRAATRELDGAAQLPDPAAEAEQIEALLHHLSRVRLAMSADLSAAAGALDDDRPDIASDVIGGATRELAELRAAAGRRTPTPSRRLVAVGAPSAPQDGAAQEPGVPEPRRQRSRHLLPRALAGAAALAVAIAVVPHVSGGSGHPATGAAAPSLTLAGSEFATLARRLTAADATPAAILAAGRSWQSAVARDLPDAATQASAASTVVTMLRAERTLLESSPALRTAQSRTVAGTLATASDGLLAQLRRLASPQVLQILPAVVEALPLASSAPPATPRTGASPAVTAPPGTTPAQPQVPTSPATGGTAPATPPTSNGTPPAAPSPAPALPSLPSLPSTLGQLPGSGDQGGQGGLGQSVGSVLNGLGLG